MIQATFTAEDKSLTASKIKAGAPAAAAAFVDLDHGVDAKVEELLNQAEVTPGPEQIAFLARVVAHFKRVLGQRLQGQPVEQRIFLLLGEGGCGKSEMIKILNGLISAYHDNLTAVEGSRHSSKDVSPTVMLAAGTNAAAVNIGGDTVHKLLGWRYGEPTVEQQQKTKVNQSLVTRWTDVHLLVLDEISMLAPSLLASLSFGLCRLREKTCGADSGLYSEPGTAFGSIPIVLSLREIFCS